MKFGVREICDVTFKAAAANQKVGNKVFAKYQPVFMIDTATTSSVEQATTTVYAQGGKGYARLIAWEGEKTMTFTVTDALMSPMGLAVLSGAGLIKHGQDDSARVHVTIQKSVKNNKVAIELSDLQEETGLNNKNKFTVCHKIPMYATTFVNDGGGTGFYEIVAPDAAIDVTEDSPAELTINGTVADGTVVVVDFYLVMNNSVTTVNIKPEDFGGFFYVEAQTLFRDEATGQDLAANLTFPKAKIQSAFTFTMAASGDPSTFDFVMDAFPGYALCRPEAKTMCDIQIISTTSDANEASDADFCKGTNPDYETPSFEDPDIPVGPSIDISGSSKVGTSTIPMGFPYGTEYQENQDATTVTVNGNTMKVTVSGGVDNLNKWTSTDAGQAALGDQPWIALDIDTGLDDITVLKYNGSALTSSDVADAAAWGLGNGHIILWIRANAVKSTAKSITLSGDDIDPVTFTITVEDAA